MKKFIKIISKITLCIVILVCLVSKSITVLAWGDNEGGRAEYTIEEINKIIEDGEWPIDKIVFNSISDSVIGHEFNYVGAREYTGPATKDTRWKANDIDVEDGKTYIIRLYVHNNNPYGMDNEGAGVAEDVRVAFNVPSVSSTQVQVNGLISSSNAVPSEYWDYVNFNSDTAFHLDYIYGSALLENNGIGNGGYSLPDEIVNAKSGGTLIGYDKIDGRIPGCYQYDNFVTIQVKAIFDYDFTIENKVRLADSEDKTWHSAVDANVGDKVEFLIEYSNTSNRTQTNVAVKDILPDNLKYIEGSTMLKNSSYPDGVNVVEDNLVENGIKIGNYAPGAKAYIKFAAEVVDNGLADGCTALLNWIHVGVGFTTIEDSAVVRVVLNVDDANEPDKEILHDAISLIFFLVCAIIIATLLRKKRF